MRYPVRLHVFRIGAQKNYWLPEHHNIDNISYCFVLLYRIASGLGSIAGLLGRSCGGSLSSDSCALIYAKSRDLALLIVIFLLTRAMSLACCVPLCITHGEVSLICICRCINVLLSLKSTCAVLSFIPWIKMILLIGMWYIKRFDRLMLGCF